MLALMVVAMLAAAMSAGAAWADPTYTIKIDNSANTTVSIVDKEYTAYKLFDVTYTGSNASDRHAYSIDSDGDGAWAWDVIKGSLKEGSTTVYENTTYGLTFTPTAADPSVYSVTSTMTADQARALGDALQTYKADASVKESATATAETVDITVPEAGYYLVFGTVKANDPSDGSKTLTAAVSLTTADPTETVKPKVSAPTLDKKITGQHVLDDKGKAATAQVGTTVSFEIDSVVPDVTGYSAYTFVITDKMTNGLDYVADSLKLYINNSEKTAGATKDYTLAVDGRTLTVTVPLATLRAATAGQAIKVTYDATVNSTALSTDYEKNTASLQYSNNPYDNSSKERTPDKEVYVIDVDINVDKVANSATGGKLADAKFKVFKGATEPEADALSWYKWDATNNKVTWVAKADADEFATTAAGKFNPNVRGLEAENAGTAYGLLEIEAPAGYNMLAEPVIVTLTGAYSESTTEKTATITADGATVTNGTVNLGTAQTDDQPLATAQVINNSGTELPSTGGMGTTILYVLGAVLVIGAGVFLVTKRRVRAGAGEDAEI